MFNIRCFRSTGPWLGFRHKRVDAEYYGAKEHKLGHTPHGPDKDPAACTLFPSRVNSRDVGRGKLYKDV
jgi:hypothetical protein